MSLAYLSVCSGIEAATVAWKPLGWRPVAFAEIEPFPSAVLAHHYPGVPNLGDITRFKDWPDADFDVLVGGTPCQSFSVAGLRKGLADPRGNLALTYLAIADRYRPEWLVWENVPGVLSSSGGRDFGAFIGGLEELGYHAAWRVLDAQYIRVDGFARAVPQRRRRVFVVGHLGDWRRAAAVLFEPESLSGHPAPRREAGKGIAAGAGLSAAISSGQGWWDESDVGATIRSQDSVTKADTLIASHDPAVTLTARDYKGPLQEADLSTVVAHALRADGFDASEDGTGRATLVPVIADTLTRGAESAGKGGYAGRRREDDANLVAFALGSHAGAAEGDQSNRNHASGGPVGSNISEELAYTLRSEGPTQRVARGWAVRRLTPTECERLQGFPDGYTAITYRGKPAADGPRYKVLGNSKATNCVRWLGRRIDFVRFLASPMHGEV